MNSSIFFPNLWRLLILVVVQGLVLKQITTSVGSEYFNILLYPLVILFLPIEMPTAFVVGIGFFTGLLVDFFYNSPGLHASAGAWSGYLRKILVMAFQPRAGYSGKEIIPAPAYLSWSVFLQLSGIFMFLHLIWYFSVDEFTLIYFGKILLRTLASWALSMIFLLFFTLVVNPKK